MSLPFCPQPKPDRLAEAEQDARALERLDFGWQLAVKHRDHWICQICDGVVKKTLAFVPDRAEADHIYPKSTYPELRHEVDNGCTTCLRCHRQAQKDRSLIPQWIRDRAAACFRRVLGREPKELCA